MHGVAGGWNRHDVDRRAHRALYRIGREKGRRNHRAVPKQAHRSRWYRGGHPINRFRGPEAADVPAPRIEDGDAPQAAVPRGEGVRGQQGQPFKVPEFPGSVARAPPRGNTLTGGVEYQDLVAASVRHGNMALWQHLHVPNIEEHGGGIVVAAANDEVGLGGKRATFDQVQRRIAKIDDPHAGAVGDGDVVPGVWTGVRSAGRSEGK